MKIANDISKLTTIPTDEVEKVISCMNDCICYNLQEGIKNKDDFLDVDIGIGNLTLSINNDTIEYKFIPSTTLEDNIKYTFEHNCCPLVEKLESSLRNKIFGAYKEFF